jgi:hypothetical protein
MPVIKLGWHNSKIIASKKTLMPVIKLSWHNSKIIESKKKLLCQSLN